MLEHIVEELHKSAVVSLCEVSAGQVMLLLQLAESLTAASKGVSPAGHQPVTWPDSGLAAAAALRQLTESMLKDVDEVLAAYDAAAADVLASAQKLEGRLQAMRETLRASVAGEAAAAAAATAAGGVGAAEKQAPGHEEQQQEEQQQGAEGQPGADAAASEGGRPPQPGGSRSGGGAGSSSSSGGSSGAAADEAAVAAPLKPRTTRAAAEAQALPGVLSEAHGAAVRVLRDGFRGLLYVVLLSSIHKAGLRAAPPAAATAEEGAAQAAAAAAGDGSGEGAQQEAPDAAAATTTAAAGPETADTAPPVDGGSATPAAVAAAEGARGVEGGKAN
jgi:hypothetical protein